ncbi:MAG: type II toxin-antitoxin system VapC family toxin [Polyangiaceae bacterium]|nr:type II toxin-antitoxin system VapC family toxin [Polyangiaceae bacterium]
MARRALLDTGFVIALVNAADPDHERCVAVWRGLHAQLLSVEGVLVECAHMLRKTKGGAAAAVHLVEEAGTRLVPLSELGSDRVLELMAKYRDVPMDLVDALLVAVAEKHAVREVLTLDRRGFDTYRANGRERFHVFP